MVVSYLISPWPPGCRPSLTSSWNVHTHTVTSLLPEKEPDRGKRTSAVSEQLRVRMCCASRAESWRLAPLGVEGFSLESTAAQKACSGDIRTHTTGTKTQRCCSEITPARRSKTAQYSQLIFRIICCFPCESNIYEQCRSSIADVMEIRGWVEDKVGLIFSHIWYFFCGGKGPKGLIQAQ